MASVKIGIRSKRVTRADRILIDSQDFVHESERLLLRQQVEQFVRTKLYPERLAHASMRPPREFSDGHG